VAHVARKTGCDPAASLSLILDRAGQRRLLAPAEVAAAVRWLCGDEAAEVNGRAIVFDADGRPKPGAAE